jgi:hypothetical protein
VPEQALPTTFGVEGVEIRETVGSQLLTPFRLLWPWRREPAAEPPSESHPARP